MVLLMQLQVVVVIYPDGVKLADDEKLILGNHDDLEIFPTQ